MQIQEVVINPVSWHVGREKYPNCCQISCLFMSKYSRFFVCFVGYYGLSSRFCPQPSRIRKYSFCRVYIFANLCIYYFNCFSGFRIINCESSMQAGRQIYKVHFRGRNESKVKERIFSSIETKQRWPDRQKGTQYSYHIGIMVA